MWRQVVRITLVAPPSISRVMCIMPKAYWWEQCMKWPIQHHPVGKRKVVVQKLRGVKFQSYILKYSCIYKKYSIYTFLPKNSLDNFTSQWKELKILFLFFFFFPCLFFFFKSAFSQDLFYFLQDKTKLDASRTIIGLDFFLCLLISWWMMNISSYCLISFSLLSVLYSVCKSQITWVSGTCTYCRLQRFYLGTRWNHTYLVKSITEYFSEE